MTRLPTDHSVYYNSRRVFLDQNRIAWFAPAGKIRVDMGPKFRDWLQAQGCEISRPSVDGLVTDSLGVAPGYQWLEFEDDALATMFMLRWS
jgi:hypothetical protein